MRTWKFREVKARLHSHSQARIEPDLNDVVKPFLCPLYHYTLLNYANYLY
jgi:hypothetical protein